MNSVEEELERIRTEHIPAEALRIIATAYRNLAQHAATEGSAQWLDFVAFLKAAD